MSRLEAKVPPPVVALSLALLMWALARAAPSYAVRVPARMQLALGVALIGLAIVVAGAIEFRRARTTTNPLAPGSASALVVTGVYRFTRNPMYLGFAVVLLAWAIYLSHLLALLGILFFVLYINRFQIAPEEQALRALFPGTFEMYASRVRRWI